MELGTGRDGDLVVTEAIVVNRYAPLAADAGSGSTEISVAFGLLEPGQLVMLHETQDSSLGVSDLSQTAFFLDEGVGVGRWELARVVADLGGGRFRLDRPLGRAWRAAGSQVISVPEYASAVVADGGVLTGKPWDSRSGGVIAALVQGALMVAEGGAIVADGLGFRGAPGVGTIGEGVSGSGYNLSQPALPTVSGGNESSGGSNAGRGGVGVVGTDRRGGLPLVASPGERLLLGGGGGSGGGSGGGAVLLWAGSLKLVGPLSTKGAGGPPPSSIPGGGAGGTIDLRGNGAVECHGVSAQGGPGSEFYGQFSGGGGGGRVYVEGRGARARCAASALAGLRGGPQNDPTNRATPATEADPLHIGEVVLVDRDASGGGVSISSPVSGAFVRTRRPVVAGLADADGGAVTVLVDDALDGMAPVDADGRFAWLAPSDLAEGPHTVVAEVDGGARSAAVRFTVDTVPPPAPELDYPPDGASLESVPLAVEGRATPGAVVRVSLDDVARGAVPTGADGRFSVALAGDLALGEHRLRVVVADEAGNEAADEHRVTVRSAELRELRTGCGCAALSAELPPAALVLLGALSAAGRARRRRSPRGPGAESWVRARRRERRAWSASPTSLVVLLALMAAPSAKAERDTFGLGDGHRGPLVVPAGTVMYVNFASEVTAPVDRGATSLSVQVAVGFSPGDLVMVLSQGGGDPEPDGGWSATTLDVTGLSAGRWELARLRSVAGPTLGLTAPLEKAFPLVGTQVVLVPEYTSVRVLNTGWIAALPWDGKRGGVAAFLATDELNVESGGSKTGVSASGAGLRGGALVLGGADDCAGRDALVPAGGGAKGESAAGGARFGPMAGGWGAVANGGGGGACGPAGGGGGGHVGAGGRGGFAVDAGGLAGEGGAALVAGEERLLFGGGGGSGRPGNPTSGAWSGGAGGGIVWLRARRINLSHPEALIRADGESGHPDSHYSGFVGGGGGGAGGTIVVRCVEGLGHSGNVLARGGGGGNQTSAWGGGGGGGSIFLQAREFPGYTGASALGGLALAGGATGERPGGDGVFTLLNVGVAVPSAPAITSPADGGTVSASFEVSGTAPPYTQVLVALDGIDVTSAPSGASGNYGATLSAAPGRHVVQARTLAAGSQSPPSESVHVWVLAPDGGGGPPTDGGATPQPRDLRVGLGCRATPSAAGLLGLLFLVGAIAGRGRRAR